MRSFFQAVKFRSSSSQTTFLDRNIVHTLNVAPTKIPASAAPTTAAAAAAANGDATDASGFAALALSSATAGAAPAAPGDPAAADGCDKGRDGKEKESLKISWQDYLRFSPYKCNTFSMNQRSATKMEEGHLLTLLGKDQGLPFFENWSLSERLF